MEKMKSMPRDIEVTDLIGDAVQRASILHSPSHFAFHQSPLIVRSWTYSSSRACPSHDPIRHRGVASYPSFEPHWPATTVRCVRGNAVLALTLVWGLWIGVKDSHPSSKSIFLLLRLSTMITSCLRGTKPAGQGQSKAKRLINRFKRKSSCFNYDCARKETKG